MIRITDTLMIPMRELTFVATTGSGPGGQHVNRVATKIVLLWDVDASLSISALQKRRILQQLSTRINKLGVMRVTSSKYRSQKANRSATIERFVLLLADVLKPRAIRKKTRVPSRQKAKRLDEKRRRSVTKSLRKPPSSV